MANQTQSHTTFTYRLARSQMGMSLRLASRVTAKLALRPLRLYKPLRQHLRLPSDRLANLPGTDAGATGTFKPLDPVYREIWARPRMLPGTDVPELYRTERVVETEPTGVLVLRNARYWGHYAGSILDSDDRIISPVSKDTWGPYRHTAFTRLRLPPITELKGRTLVLSTPEADTNYHHWIVDLLPRIDLARRAGFAIESFDWIIVNHRGARYQLETLGAAHLGLDPKKIIRSTPDLHLRAETLIVPTIVRDNTRISRRASAATRSLVKAAAAGATERPKRLYLSRGDASFRRVLNEPAVIDALAAFGFTAVQMSKHTVAEQVALMQDADFIAGPAGANLASVLFARPEARVLELLPPGWVHPYNWGLAETVGAPFYALLNGASESSGPLVIEKRYQDFTVDVKALAAIADWMTHRA